jgi:mannose-6-phosphate isomerase-like protein (cupin superfamily)
MSIPRVIAIVAALYGSIVSIGAEQAPRPVPTTLWAPKPAKTAAYGKGLKPWVKLDDLKAKYKGRADWQEVVVDDGRLAAQYISTPPKTGLTRRLHPDTREWFAVVEGELRVEIEGQEPFTATRGSLVNIPRQTFYSVQNTGAAPALWFTLNVSGAKTLFPQEAAPPAPSPGHPLAEVRLNRTPGRYDEFNQPHLNIHEAAAKNEKYAGGRFVRDDKSEMLVLYGHEKNLPPLDPSDKGHFHAESAEMWLVFSGRIRYSFEGQKPFIASEGDVVYVPSNTWHATRYIGDNSCRLSITEYVGNALLLPPSDR